MPQVPPPKRHPYDQWSPDARALDLVGDKWTLLIVRDLAAGPRRFVELQRILPGISTEQLRSRLNRMVADGMLTRKRYREVPPRVDYELTPRARALMPVLAELAVWGYEWSWSKPRTGERIDVGAIFRLIPGLVKAEGRFGEVELEVTSSDPDAVATTYTVVLRGDSVEAVADRTDNPTAKLTGATSAWIAALSPGTDSSGIEFSGDGELGASILAQLACAAAQAQARAGAAESNAA